jgi:hypothetical protein
MTRASAKLADRTPRRCLEPRSQRGAPGTLFHLDLTPPDLLGSHHATYLGARRFRFPGPVAPTPPARAHPSVQLPKRSVGIWVLIG